MSPGPTLWMMLLAYLQSGIAGAAPDDRQTGFRTDPLLRQSLARRCHWDGMDNHVEKRRVSIAVADLTWPDRPFYAGLGDTNMLYAASLPKIAILLAVIQRVQDGTLAWNPTFAFKLQKMITISSNTFASWGYDQATPAGIAEVLQRARYRLYERPHGGLWVGRPFRKASRSYRDPVYNISHGASARQTARFYWLLDQGKLVSRYWSARMMALMAPPEYPHKFVAAIGQRPGVHFLARKSGTWRDFHSDSALVRHYHHKYIIVGLVQRWDGEGFLRRLALCVHETIVDGDHRR